MTKKKKQRKSEKNMPEEIIRKVSDASGADSSSAELADRIKSAAEGLFYPSETDAEILSFIGTKAETTSKAEILKQTGAASDSAVEEKDFAGFFARLTEIQDWYEAEEKETVQKFVRLRAVLEDNIRELKVFRIGKIRLDVYVVGLDAENTFLGIKTKAVET